MKNLFIVISDVHISLKNLEISLKVLRQALEKARELNVPLIIAGDLNDTKAVMRSEWVQALINLFQEFGSVEIHIIDGNHDLNNKAGSASSLAFLHLIDNVYVYHTAEEVEFGGVPFCLLPYQKTKKEFLEAIERIACNKLICHQGFQGAFLGDYVVDDSSIDPEELKDFELVLSGHYHRHQWVGDNIMYFGSPFTVNFGEAGHDKFIWQIYHAEGKVNCQPIATQVRKHIQFTLEPDYGLKLMPNELQNAREEDLVKVIMKGPKEFALSRPPITHPNITLVPDIQHQSEERISQEIAHEPIKVIESYLEKAYTTFDKEELKTFLWTNIADILNSLSNKVRKKIKVHKAIANNFLSYEKLEYEYTSKGLTLIEGHDEDYDISTGAGKSSFLDVACYGLFGKTSKKLKADEVINRKAGKNMFVQIELTVDGQTMLITRYRKDQEYDNDFLFAYAGQGEPTRGKDSIETQKLLEKELGIDMEMFLISSYFTQFGAIDNFLSSSDSDKKKLISEICDTKIYDEIVEELKQVLKRLLNKKASLEDAHIAQSSKVDVIQGNVSNYQTKMEEYEVSKKNNITMLEQQGEAWENKNASELVDLMTQSSNFESNKKTRINKAIEDQKLWDSQEALNVEKIKENINYKTTQRNEYLAKSELPQQPSFDEETSKIQSKLTIISNLKEEIAKLDVEIGTKDRIIRGYNTKIDEANSINVESKCLSCYQPISKEHIGKHINEIKVLIENEDREQKILLAKRSQIKESTKVQSELEVRLKEIESERYKYQTLLSTYQQNKRVAEDLLLDISNLESSLLNRQANPHSYTIEAINKESNPFLDKIELNKLSINPFVDKIKEESERINPYTQMFHDEADKLKAEENKLSELDSEAGALQKEIDFCNWWKDAIHIYIKSYLTDSFIDQVNEYTNDKLNQMFDGILSFNMSAQQESGKTTKEKINVTIYNKNEECSYNSLSGGERCRICLALNLAVRSATNINIGFIMFDEVLNGLDEVGKSQVMRVFKELESEYESVFVIDHTTEFKSLFTNNIMIRKSNGVSEIVE